MEREVELLSRLSHPSIPRLLDRGGPQLPSGDESPFFVMEWVQGTPLYAWAEQHAPSSQQLCRVLGQLARALEAVHAAGAVHRDVKGDNVLVRLQGCAEQIWNGGRAREGSVASEREAVLSPPADQAESAPEPLFRATLLSDRRAVLIDFGSCHFAGAQRLTWQSLPPMTPEYLSPQAVHFYLHSQGQPDGYYPPSPADDLYALGVTAYRLVMGQYPARGDARQDEQGTWQVTSPDLRPLLESNPRLEPPLREVIVQLLSHAPEQRGTAAQVAQALEAATGEKQGSACSMPPERARVWKPWLTLAAAGACAVLLWSSKWVPRAFNAQAPEAGTTAIGDTSPTEPQTAPVSPEENRPIAQQPLPLPRPGQARPDEKGRCLGPKQVPINGGCWVELLPMSTEECVQGGYVPFQGKCYLPAPAPPKKPAPTSSPGQAR
jgi:serine/threonine protein kinase